jgi:hypothetical protein
MNSQRVALFNYDDVGSSHKRDKRVFSKAPVIRRFESLLTDQDFECAGLKIAPHPTSDTFYIYPASELFATNYENLVVTNAIAPGRFGPYHDSLWLDPLSRREPAKDDLPSILERINELRDISAEENLPFEERSAEEALEWLRMMRPRELPSVFLVNNGNTRLFWRDGDRQLGLQFLGNGSAQFVYLGDDDQSERVFGSMKVTEVVGLISGLDLWDILGLITPSERH